MSDHDPLCSATGRCRCWLIAMARADERERIARAIEARRDSYVSPAGIAIGGRTSGAVFYADAARIARGGT